MWGMFGFLIAAALFGLKFASGSALFETAFIESARFLFWWYVVAGSAAVFLAALAWAGDLGTEGARLRHGIPSTLGWLIGLARVPLSWGSALIYLFIRRLALGTGAYLLTQGLQEVGALFIWDERLLLIGGVVLAFGLVGALFVSLLRRRISTAATVEVVRSNSI